MTDKTLLQEARDALDKEHGKLASIATTHPHLVEMTNGPSECDVCQTILRLDAELAKVAEPVEGEREIVVLRSVIGSRKDMGMTSDAIARAVWQAGYRLPGRPGVLDLRFVAEYGDIEKWLHRDDLLAAIRAQLKDVEVRT